MWIFYFVISSEFPLFSRRHLIQKNVFSKTHCWGPSMILVAVCLQIDTRLTQIRHTISQWFNGVCGGFAGSSWGKTPGLRAHLVSSEIGGGEPLELFESSHEWGSSFRVNAKDSNWAVTKKGKTSCEEKSYMYFFKYCMAKLWWLKSISSPMGHLARSTPPYLPSKRFHIYHIRRTNMSIQKSEPNLRG